MAPTNFSRALTHFKGVKTGKPNIAGQSYRFEVESDERNSHIKVEMSPERFRALDLGVGETVYIDPRALRLFKHDGAPVPMIGAELSYNI